MKPVILIGGGGHAKVVASTLLELKIPILGFTDPEASRSTLFDIPRLGDDQAILRHPADEIWLAQGLGSIRPSAHRAEVFERFKSLGYSFITLIHPAAIVAMDVEIGEGSVIFAGAVVQAGTRIAANTILNTRCSVDHDCVIGSHVHISPGATLSADIHAEAGCHIGVGSTCIQGIRIGENALVGAGSVVLRNVPPGRHVFGVPARAIPT
jgi:UDP-perosamine 4-acetyltransferase